MSFATANVQSHNSLNIARELASICFEVTGYAPDTAWSPGPMPWKLPDGGLTDGRTRRTYFQARAADSLYGAEDGSSLCRWHRGCDQQPDTSSFTVRGLELVKFREYVQPDHIAASGDTQRYLAIVHLDLHSKDDPIELLQSLVSLNPDTKLGLATRELYLHLLGDGYNIPVSTRRAFSISMFTFTQVPPPDLPGAPEQWSIVTSWLWASSTATSLTRYCPDLDDPSLLNGIVYLSASWRALVVRDGIGFIGLVSDSPDQGVSFFPWAEVYVRSIYSDVAVLAFLQRDALNGFADRLGAIGDRFEKSNSYKALINSVTEFRNVFWWDDVTLHGAANELLDRLHSAHRTPSLFSRVTSDLDAFRQQVEAYALEASVAIQELEEKHARQFDRFASIAAISFAVPALTFAALALPIRGLTAGSHDFSPWAVTMIGVCAILFGMLLGTIGASLFIRRIRKASPRSEP
jgi:hypothetical protein